MDSDQLSAKGKRKVGKVFESKFKVVKEHVKKNRLLKILKPDVESVVAARELSFPAVHLKKERDISPHAFLIMHNLNHKNILSLKAFGKKNNDTANSVPVSTFVEPYDGLLWSKCIPEACADKIRHVPSLALQSFIRQIVTGLHFLWTNGIYHGNLNWSTTLYYQSVVKLAGFTESKASIEEGQWYDVICLITMLEELSERINASCVTVSLNGNYFCGHLHSLIQMLKTLELTPISRRKETILGNVFFWDFTRKVNFFINDISLMMNDDQFKDNLRNSRLCGEPFTSWYAESTLEFKNLVKVMNTYRQSKGLNTYKGEKVEDYVRCICGAYTHWMEIELNIDTIVRVNHPSIIYDLDRLLVGTSVKLISASEPPEKTDAGTSCGG